MKRCPRCHDRKPLDEFGKDKHTKDGLTTNCKPCRRARQAEWYDKNREASIEKAKKWNRENPEKVKQNEARRNRTPQQMKITRLKNDYHMTDEEIDYAMSITACQNCGNVLHLHIDHCHRSLKFRGVLCSGCNSALGMVDDDIERLEGLIAYLKRSNSEEQKDSSTHS